ncbi:MAG: redoxin domain-containing protein, partial [Bacteroidota bacterium]
MIVMENRSFFEILLSEGKERFSVNAKTSNFVKTAKFEGSEENTLFYTYLNYLSKQRQEASTSEQVLKDENASEEDKEKARESLKTQGERVRAYQEKLVTENPGSLPASVIRASWQVDIPEYKDETDSVRKIKQLEFYQEHYFDNIDFSDGRLVRTPMLEPKLRQYFKQLIVPVPDSVTKAIDFVMGKIIEGKDKEMYKFVVSMLLNKYASEDKTMFGEDIYAHIALNYYDDPEMVDWMKEKDRKKILSQAQRIMPLRIGQKAPNLELKTLDGELVSLHGIDAKYTIIYFWDPDCGICKKASKVLTGVYDRFKQHDVEVFGICNKTYEELEKCGQSAREKGMKWINTADPYGQGQAHAKYAIQANPVLYILDENKVIRYKKIGAKQIDEVLSRELGLEPAAASSDTGEDEHTDDHE